MELEESAVINEIKTIFESENESAIHDAIAYIHENGSIKMLPLLFDLLAITKSESTKNDIYECLSDTKEKSATAIFIEALQDSRFVNEISHILSAMWQSNLDFSKYTKVFIQLLIQENYETALEAYTIIEVCAGNLPAEEKTTYKEMIEKALKNEKSEKAGLLQSTIEAFEL